MEPGPLHFKLDLTQLRAAEARATSQMELRSVRAQISAAEASLDELQQQQPLAAQSSRNEDDNEAPRASGNWLTAVLLFLSFAVGLGAVLYSDHILRFRSDRDTSAATAVKPSGDRVYTQAELKKYVGTKAGGDPRIFMAILGEVFDVSSGAAYYAHGEGYAGFAGRDATAAFLSGDFTPAGLHDDLAGLAPTQIVDLYSWRDNTYVTKYIPMGVVVGRFYDAQGEPTAELVMVRELAKKGEAEKLRLSTQRARFVGCNSKWTQADGKTLWCHEPLVVRHQVLVDGAGKETLRCVCASGAPGTEGVQLHPECPDPKSSTCRLPTGGMNDS